MLIPGFCLVIILFNEKTIFIHISQTKLTFCIAQSGSFKIKKERFLVILFDAMPFTIQISQHCVGFRMFTR